MIKNNDTLLYKEEIEIHKTDTFFNGTCWTFEKINGQVINQQDKNCIPFGQWMITDCIGNYKVGEYMDGKPIGIWKQFNKKGKLLKESETVSIGRETYTIKEIDYSSGKATIIIDKPFLAFYLKNLFSIAVVFFITFFSRVFINSKIYNIENSTKLQSIHLPLDSIKADNFEHNIKCTFSFWFSNYKTENRKRVLITNTLSIISLSIFFGLIIGLALTGEI
jgi:hypothetical protein